MSDSDARREERGDGERDGREKGSKGITGECGEWWSKKREL